MIGTPSFFATSFSRRLSENSDWFSFKQQVIFVRSLFDLSVNYLGVLLHGDTLVLVLHGFLVEVDLWDGWITSLSFSPYCPCWTSASVLGCFGSGWLQLSSVNSVSPRTSP